MTAEEKAKDNRTRALLRGLRNCGLTVLYHGADMSWSMIENPPSDWPPLDEVITGGDAVLFDAATAARIIETKRGVLDSGFPARMEVARRLPGQETRWFEMHIEADQGDQDGARADTLAIRGLFVSLNDITELKTREETLRTLLYEVSHRSRNLLAILQSVLGHTARGTTNIAVFERKFRGRIAALAHSQDLITRSNWQGIRFQRLVMDQMSNLIGPGNTPPALVGPDLLIGPNSALHLGLALHELAANSASFGALASGAGEITIETAVEGERHSMSWTEVLDEPADAQPGAGFGRAILSQIVPRALNGQFDLQIAPKSVTYRITWPETSLA